MNEDAVLFENEFIPSKTLVRELAKCVCSKVLKIYCYTAFSVSLILLALILIDAFTVGDYETFVAFLREKLKDNPKALKGVK